MRVGLVAPGGGDLSSPATRILSLTSDNISDQALPLVDTKDHQTKY